MSIFKKLMGYPADENKSYDYGKREDVEYARDLIDFIQVASSEEVLGLADKLLNGIPLVLNFEQVPISEANQVISFLSGIIYAKDGVNLQVQPKVFLFCLHELLEDGTVMEFYEEYKEKE